MHRLNAWFRRHPILVDSAWGLLVLGFGMASVAGAPDSDWQFFSGAAVSVAVALLMAFRRRDPDLVTAAGVALGLTQIALGIEPRGSAVGYLVFGYTAAAFGSPWASRLALAAGLAAGPLDLWRFGGGPMPVSHAVQVLFVGMLKSTPFILCWAWGRLVRVRRAYLIELEDRAARLERERDAQAQVAVAAERARIARELHDVVAHNVSVMIVQADGAAYVLDGSPEQAREALSTIASTGRQALVEMRRLLGVLRTADSAEEYVPQPGVEQLPELLEQVRRAGLPVEFTASGEPSGVPRGVELTVYRIVQEALTNARKHGGHGVRARVAVDFREKEVEVLVEDDGRGPAAEQPGGGGADGPGHGLIGMRERIGMVGGGLDVGPRPGGGFRVRATLPLRTPK